MSRWNVEKLREYLKDRSIVVTSDTVSEARLNFKGLLRFPATFGTV